MASNGKAEYVTLEVSKEMMEIQDRAYRSTLQILVNDMKSEIKPGKRTLKNSNLSTQFMSWLIKIDHLCYSIFVV